MQQVRAGRQRSRDLDDRRPRGVATQEQRLGHEERADAGQYRWSSSASPIGRSAGAAGSRVPSRRPTRHPGRRARGGRPAGAPAPSRPGRASRAGNRPPSSPRWPAPHGRRRRGAGHRWGCDTAGRARASCPSIFRWLCKSSAASLAASIRVSRCLPTLTTSTTRRPVRSTVARDGQRRLGAVSARPASCLVQALRGASDAVALGHAARRLRPRRRRPRGVGWNPAASSAAARVVGRPPRRRRAPRSACPARPSRTASGQRVGRGARARSASSVNDSSVRPPRSTYSTRPPSTSTTSAPALRPGRWPGRPPVGARSGQGSAAPYGLAGSAAASTSASARRPGRRRRGRVARTPRAAGRPRRRWRTGPRPAPRRSSRGGPGRSPPARQHPVDGGEPAGHPLGHHRAPGDHAVPVQQHLGGGVRPQGRRRSRRRAAATSGRPPSAARPGPAIAAAGRGTGAGRPQQASPRRASRAAVRRPAGARPPAGSRARSGASVSLLTSPAQTRSHSAVGDAASASSGAAVHRVGRACRKKSAPPPAEHVEHRLVQRVRSSDRVGAGSGQRQRRGVGRVQRHPAVAARQRAVPGPETSPAAVSSSSMRGRVAGHPGGQHQRLQRRRRAPARPAAARPPAARRRRRAARRRPRCRCQAGRNRASAAGRPARPRPRSAASDRRRSSRSTSASHHSGSPAGARRAAVDRAGTRPADRRRPGAASRRSASVTTATPSPNRAAALGREERPVGAGVPARPGRRAGRRPARGTPRRPRPAAARRARRAAAPASSTAAQCSSPAIRTRIARRAASSAGQRGRGQRPAGVVDARGQVDLGGRRAGRASAAGRRCPRRRGPGGPRREPLQLGLGVGQRRPGRAARAGRPAGRAARPAASGRAASAAARRSASGASPSYRNAPT